MNSMELGNYFPQKAIIAEYPKNDNGFRQNEKKNRKK
jgi:hypothetical protein